MILVTGTGHVKQHKSQRSATSDFSPWFCPLRLLEPIPTTTDTSNRHLVTFNEKGQATPPPQTLPRKYLTTTGCLQTSMVCLQLRVHVNPQKNTVGVMLPGTAGNRAKEGVGVVLRPLTINAIHVLDPSYAVSTRNPSSSHSEGHPTPAWSKTPDQKHQWAACCCSCKRLVCTCCSYTCYYK